MGLALFFIASVVIAGIAETIARSRDSKVTSLYVAVTFSAVATALDAVYVSNTRETISEHIIQMFFGNAWHLMLVWIWVFCMKELSGGTMYERLQGPALSTQPAIISWFMMFFAARPLLMA